jgi:replication factor A3
MDHPQTPRILAPHLQQFQHRIVRILGKVVQLHGETAVIDAGGNVDLILNRVRGNHGMIGEACTLSRSIIQVDSAYATSADIAFKDCHLARDHAVEIIGKVDGNLAIKVQAATDFGTNIGTYGSF